MPCKRRVRPRSNCATKLTRLGQERSQYEEDSATLKNIVGGYPQETPVTHIRHDYALDVCEVFPPNNHLDSAAYRDMVAHLVRSIRDAAAREAEAVRRERTLGQRLDDEQQQHESRIGQHRLAQADLRGNWPTAGNA